jgi:hypothetical protein
MRWILPGIAMQAFRLQGFQVDPPGSRVLRWRRPSCLAFKLILTDSQAFSWRLPGFRAFKFNLSSSHAGFQVEPFRLLGSKWIMPGSQNSKWSFPVPNCLAFQRILPGSWAYS